MGYHGLTLRKKIHKHFPLWASPKRIPHSDKTGNVITSHISKRATAVTRFSGQGWGNLYNLQQLPSPGQLPRTLLVLFFYVLYLRVVAQITPISAKTTLQDSLSKIMGGEKVREYCYILQTGVFQEARASGADYKMILYKYVMLSDEVLWREPWVSEWRMITLQLHTVFLTDTFRPRGREREDREWMIEKRKTEK